MFFELFRVRAIVRVRAIAGAAVLSCIALATQDAESNAGAVNDARLANGAAEPGQWFTSGRDGSVAACDRDFAPTST